MSPASIPHDEPASQDKLKRDFYARALARVAETCETPLVIGLYGTWGIGKTTLMKLIQKELTNSSISTVWFDAWQHQFDENPALALLHAVVNTFKMGEEGKKLLAVISSAFGSLLLKATTTLDAKDLDTFGERYEQERFLVRDARVRLREHFEELIQKAQTAEKHRLVFFIDDLDRCLPPQTLSLLEALKLYLNLDGCVFFLGVDRAALERSIRHHYKDVEVSEANYLDKIVQLPFTIPPVAPDSMDGFVSSLLPQELVSCKKLLVLGLGDNPRQVKRFISTLALNHQLASELNIPNYDPKVLALVLLFQSLEWERYRLLPKHLGLLHDLKVQKEETKVLRVNERLKDALADVDIPRELDIQYIYLTQAARVTGKVGPSEREFDFAAILSEHGKWVDSGGKAGKRADLRGVSLPVGTTEYGDSLWSANLRGADLRGSSAATIYLGGDEIHVVHMAGADLRGANLHAADLEGAEGLTEQQLASALTSEETTLPDGSKGPFKPGSGAHQPRGSPPGRAKVRS
ncbi:MAG: AAA family ATPase [Acidobacteria bacterium]|nr:AAA family ATPase [Acidobacteriota bacterium]